MVQQGIGSFTLFHLNSLQMKRTESFKIHKAASVALYNSLKNRREEKKEFVKTIEPQLWIEIL